MEQLVVGSRIGSPQKSKRHSSTERRYGTTAPQRHGARIEEFAQHFSRQPSQRQMYCLKMCRGLFVPSIHAICPGNPHDKNKMIASTRETNGLLAARDPDEHFTRKCPILEKFSFKLSELKKFILRRHKSSIWALDKEKIN